MIHAASHFSHILSGDELSLPIVEVADLGALCLALNQFKVAAGSNPPIQLFQVFCYVASHPSCLQADMEKVTGMSNSSCSRMVMWLGPRKADGSQGLGLVKSESNPKYYKQNLLSLTPKGEMLADLLIQNLTSIN